MISETVHMSQANTVRKPFDDTFGNYLIHGIDEVFLPQVVSWWPTTLAWKVVAAMILFYLCWRTYHAVLKWRRNQYRRIALKQLDRLLVATDDRPELIGQLPLILKATALHAYPRAEVASLSGNEWLQLLDSKCPTTKFNSEIGKLLLAITYQPLKERRLDRDQSKPIFIIARRWVRDHIEDSDKVMNV